MSQTFLIEKIVSGGQTGVDQAAFDTALTLGFSVGGWCPKGRLAENGTIPAHYPLTETQTDKYEERTELNARDSDGTLILYRHDPEGGTKFTVECANKYSRPTFMMELSETPDTQKFLTWMKKENIKVLNIAGPRESLEPGYIYKRATEVLKEFLSMLIA